MKKSLLLKQQRGVKVDRLKAINSAAEARENKALNDDENAEVTQIRAAIKSLDDQIANAELMEAELLDQSQRQLDNDPEEQRSRERLLGGNPTDETVQKDYSRMRKEFSFVRTIAALNPNDRQKLDGLEAEVIQEGEREALAKKIGLRGVGIPSFFMGTPQQKGLQAKKEQRTNLTVGTSATAGYLVETGIHEVVEYLDPETVLMPLGARFLTGLQSNLDLIRQTGRSVMTWEGENDDAAETNPTFGTVPMRPKRGSAFTVFGTQLKYQTGVVSVENMVREDLMIATGQGLEITAISGATGGSNPVGILNTTGVGSVAIGTNGGPITWPLLRAMKREVSNANALRGRLAYLTNPDQTYMGETVKKDAGSGIFIIENGKVGNYPVFETTNVPGNITKGAGNDLSAWIFGDWSQLYISQWGGLDMVVDPYTLAGKAQIKVTINGWWDVTVRQLGAFCWIKDATTV